jgi:hypothetical protein
MAFFIKVWRFSCYLFSVLALAALAGRITLAAPQILGLVASDDALPLSCERGVCATQASTFCLQKWRQSPPAGTRFVVADNQGLRLIVTTNSGLQVIVPNPQMSIISSRGHTSVRLSVDVAWMDQRDYRSALLEIGPNVSLIPVAVAGDPKPQSVRDIKLATGPLRALGARMVDRSDGASGTALGAARLLNRVASALPSLGRSEVSIREQAWEVGMRGVVKASVRQRAAARGEFERCFDATLGGYVSLRQCLGSRHDILVGRMNDRYWAATDQNM